MIKAFLLVVAMFFSASVLSGVPTMSCKFSPPGSNTWGANCLETLSNPPTSMTATFRINEAPANFYIDWINPNCSSSSLTCQAIVNKNTFFEAFATVIDLDQATIYQAESFARYN